MLTDPLPPPPRWIRPWYSHRFKQEITCTNPYVVVDDQTIILRPFVWFQGTAIRAHVVIIQLTVFLTRRRQVVKRDATTVAPTFFKAAHWLRNRDVLNM